MTPQEAEEMILAGKAPDGMRVDGDLDLKWASSLPRGLSVSGNLSLKSCSMTSLGDDLDVGGGLVIQHCKGLTRLGDRIHVRGDLQWYGKIVLESIGDSLRVEGHCKLEGCKTLKRVGDRVDVGGDLTLVNCQALERLGDDIKVGRSLELGHCLTLKALPKGLYVGQSLELQECEVLESLPEGLYVGGLLNLRSCKVLQERHRGNMDAFFEQLARGMGPDAGLGLSYWDVVERVPGGLQIGGDLDLISCASLTHLGDGLGVGGDLKLSHCTALVNLGRDLRVGGMLQLGGCSALEKLPASIIEAVLRATGDDEWYPDLCGTGLSRSTLLWVDEAVALGLNRPLMSWPYDFEMDDAAPVSTAFDTVEQAVAFFVNEVSCDVPNPPIEVYTIASSSAATAAAAADVVKRFLSIIRTTKQFGISETRRVIARRVVDVLRMINQDDLARETVVARMRASLDGETTHSPALAVFHMALAVDLARARDDRHKLEELGRRVMRLELVHHHAMVKVRSLTWCDDVFVPLRFEEELRETLDLPGPPLDVAFPGYVKVDASDIDAVIVEATEITEDRYKGWLDRWSGKLTN